MNNLQAQRQVLEIKKYPDLVLRKKAAPVSEITPKEAGLFEDMLLTMYTFGGIGLSAPQVGLSLQIIVADVGEGAVRLANPCVVKTEGEDKLAEGCLSLPDTNVVIKRPYKILVRGLDNKGNPIELSACGLLARVILHEIDHLKGRLVIDYMPLLEKMKLRKLQKKK